MPCNNNNNNNLFKIVKILKNLIVLESIYMWLKKIVIPKFISCSTIIMY